MLARVDVQLFQLEPQQILQTSVCQGTFSKTQAMDLNLHEILIFYCLMQWSHPCYIPEYMTELVVDIPVQFLSHLLLKC